MNRQNVVTQPQTASRQAATQTALDQLKDVPQWVVYGPDKCPYHPVTGIEAKANGPQTWSTHNKATQAAAKHPGKYKGIGRELVKEQHIVTIDLDHCVIDGKISDYAQSILRLINSYAEFSPGDGIHIWAYGELPNNIGPDPDIPKDAPAGIPRIELFDSKKYLTWTGKHVENTPEKLEDRHDVIENLHADVRLARQNAKKTKTSTQGKASASQSSSAYAQKALQEECSSVSQAAEGARNHQLNTSAFALGQLVGTGVLSRPTVENDLYNAARGNGLTDSEIEKTLRSGLEAGIKQPREIPEKRNTSNFSQPMPGHANVKDPQNMTLEEAVAVGDIQAIMVHTPEIIEMDELQFADLKFSIKKRFGVQFPMKEFADLLRAERRQREKEKNRNVTVISARDIAAKKFETVVPIVEQILFPGLVILMGKAKIGKSWLDLGIGIAVAHGAKALGSLTTCKGDVLYLALEDTEERLNDRLNALTAGPGETVPPNFEVAVKWPRLDKGGLEALEDWIIARPNRKLIIIDPWVKIRPSVKLEMGETSYDADYRACETIKALADKYQICILIQIHKRKEKAEDYFDEGNASSGLSASADYTLNLTRTRGEADATLQGDGRTASEVSLALSFKDGYWNVLGDAKEYAMSKASKEVLDILRKTGKPMVPNAIAAMIGNPVGSIPIGTVRKRLLDMKGRGEVKDTGSGYIPLVPTTPHTDSGKKLNNNNLNRGNGGNGGNAGNGGNGGNAGNVRALPRVTERYLTENDEVTPLQEPVDTPEQGNWYHAVTSVTPVTPNAHRTPLEKGLAENLGIFKKKYKNEQRIFWTAPGTGIDNGFVTAHQWYKNFQQCWKSPDEKVRQAALEALEKKLVLEVR